MATIKIENLQPQEPQSPFSLEDFKIMRSDFNSTVKQLEAEYKTKTPEKWLSYFEDLKSTANAQYIARIRKEFPSQ